MSYIIYISDWIDVIYTKLDLKTFPYNSPPHLPHPLPSYRDKVTEEGYPREMF